MKAHHVARSRTEARTRRVTVTAWTTSGGPCAVQAVQEEALRVISGSGRVAQYESRAGGVPAVRGSSRGAQIWYEGARSTNEMHIRDGADECRE